MKTIYDELREERIAQQKAGLLPRGYTTNGYQMFKTKYLWEADSFKQQVKKIAKTAARHTDDPKGWAKKFFSVIWEEYLALSTPVLANMGTNRGLPVSCSANYIADSVYDFYGCQQEVAMLSKNGFGTASYLGDIRHRGSFTKNGKCSGVLPVYKDYVQLSRDISQGGLRRGAWAGYMNIDHPDFWEISDFILNNPDDANVGWVISDKFIKRLDEGDPDAVSRYQRSLKVKCITGKGYYWFVDKVNRMRPEAYVKNKLYNKTSNLCTEITLYCDALHTFTCILSSMNAALYDKWKNTEAVFISTIFLDCVAQEFIEKAKKIIGLEKAVRYTEKSRALGLGVLGFHTYLQKNNIIFESFEAHMKNLEIFKHLSEESLRASKWMAKKFGEPEWCKGLKVRNTHRTAIAPNTSSALMCQSVSQGIEPSYLNVFTQGSAAGEMNRINPVLLDLMKKKKVYNKDTLKRIENNKGSVKDEKWLDDHEKQVFKTAFEIDQDAILRLASARQPHICQAQSLNLFFAADEDEEYISQIHQKAFKDPNIKSLYYLRSMAGVEASKGTCIACES